MAQWWSDYLDGLKNQGGLRGGPPSTLDGPVASDPLRLRDASEFPERPCLSPDTGPRSLTEVRSPNARAHRHPFR